jgi:acetolactate synthase-1/2/3 large subunit
MATNGSAQAAITGIANAHAARAPILILSGTPPRAQENRGALQDMLHTEFVRPLTRYARTVREPDLVLQELDEALARAAGLGGEPGPVYLDFPVDTQRAEPSRAMSESMSPEWFAPRASIELHPDPAAVSQAVELLWAAKRPLVISGRGAREPRENETVRQGGRDKERGTTQRAESGCTAPASCMI